MKEVFLHSKNDLKKNVINYILLLIPLYLYGFYKNGILLYQKNLIEIFASFKIFYLLLIGLISYILVNLIMRKKIKYDLDLLNIFIIPLFMPQNISYIIYFCGLLIGLILVNILTKYINFNKMAFLKLFIIFLVIIFGALNYQNIAESTGSYVFNLWDYLFGRNVGGIGSSSIIIGVVIMIVLSIINLYKISIPISAILIFGIISTLLGSDNWFLNSSAILSLIFIASDNISSPPTKKSMIIYGILIGLLGAILCNFGLYHEGMFISILIFSILYEIVCKTCKKVL